VPQMMTMAPTHANVGAPSTPRVIISYRIFDIVSFLINARNSSQGQRLFHNQILMLPMTPAS
jgi:hypothetical protein